MITVLLINLGMGDQRVGLKPATVAVALLPLFPHLACLLLTVLRSCYRTNASGLHAFYMKVTSASPRQVRCQSHASPVCTPDRSFDVKLGPLELLLLRSGTAWRDEGMGKSGKGPREGGFDYLLVLSSRIMGQVHLPGQLVDGCRLEHPLTTHRITADICHLQCVPQSSATFPPASSTVYD